MTVPFRFETVLRVREAERDRCRISLVEQQQREALLVTDRQRIVTERLSVLDELRVIQDGNGWSADRVIHRRQQAEQLVVELTQIDAMLAEVAESLVRCRTELLESDVSVKSLEKLAGRHDTEQRRVEQIASDRDREDSWRAA